MRGYAVIGEYRLAEPPRLGLLCVAASWPALRVPAYVSRPRSSAGAEWVSAPTARQSTPVSAYARAWSRVSPPETSSLVLVPAATGTLRAWPQGEHHFPAATGNGCRRPYQGKAGPGLTRAETVGWTTQAPSRPMLEHIVLPLWPSCSP